MRSILTGLAFVGFLVLLNAIAAGVWAMLGSIFRIDSPWLGLLAAVISIGASLVVAKFIIEWPRRNRVRARE